MKYLILSFLFMSFQSIGQSPEYVKLLESYYDDTETISIAAAAKKMNVEKIFFLDTRESDEFNVSHIDGAQCVGYDDFKITSVSNISKSAEIIVYCSIGARSQTIAKKLSDAGYTNVKNMYGGFFHWANSGYPMVNDQGKDTAIIHGYSKEWGKWVTNGIAVY
jgi:rhodanese-related sulfurtransferase